MELEPDEAVGVLQRSRAPVVARALAISSCTKSLITVAHKSSHNFFHENKSVIDQSSFGSLLLSFLLMLEIMLFGDETPTSSL